MTGSPSITRSKREKSSRCTARSSSRAAASSSAPSARIARRTSATRSPRNWCSVRHRPMPSAPNRRAWAASCLGVGVGKDLQGPGLVGPVQQRDQLRAGLGHGEQGRADEDLSGGAVDGEHVALVDRGGAGAGGAGVPRRRPAPPRRTRPACPGRARRPRRGSRVRRARSGWRDWRPCRGSPPARSRGRTRITSSPAAALATASSAVKTTAPTAAPGEAGSAFVNSDASPGSASWGCSSCSSCRGATRVSASWRSITPAFARSTATATAAAAVRLATRVCRT